MRFCVVTIVVFSVGAAFGCKPSSPAEQNAGSGAQSVDGNLDPQFVQLADEFKNGRMPDDNSISPSSDLENPNRGLINCRAVYSNPQGGGGLRTLGNLPFYGIDGRGQLTTGRPVRAIVRSDFNNEWWRCEPLAAANAWRCMDAHSSGNTAFVRHGGGHFYLQRTGKNPIAGAPRSQFDSTLFVEGYVKCGYGAF